MKKTNQITRVVTNFITLTAVNTSVNEDYAELIFLDSSKYGGLVSITIDYVTASVSIHFYNGYEVAQYLPCSIAINQESYLKIYVKGSTLYLVERFF